MTIEDAILKLQALGKKHGGNTQVFFDCPSCSQSFTPGMIVAEAIHWKAEESKEKK
jgi:hypothetical protein